MNLRSFSLARLFALTVLVAAAQGCAQSDDTPEGPTDDSTESKPFDRQDAVDDAELPIEQGGATGDNDLPFNHGGRAVEDKLPHEQGGRVGNDRLPYEQGGRFGDGPRP